MSRVLIVDDDLGIRTVVSDAMVHAGHEVDNAISGSEALTRIGDQLFDLIITDLSMEDGDGMFLVREVRRKTSVPILVLTVRQDEREKIRLLDAGADDYVTKPFGVEELLARVRALLRRNRQGQPTHTYRFGNIDIDLDKQRLEKNGDEIRLTPTEFAILKTLIERPGAVRTHQQLIAAVWGESGEVTNDALRVHIRSLRRKLEDDPARPRWIRTEPWVGYRLDIDD